MVRRVPHSDRARCVLLVKELMEGKPHSRQSIAKLLKTTLRSADRWIRLAQRIPGVHRTRGILSYRPAPPALTTLDAIVAAIWERSVIRFDYSAATKTVRHCRVQPLSLAVEERELHLLARVTPGGNASSYRIADITNVVVSRAPAADSSTIHRRGCAGSAKIAESAISSGAFLGGAAVGRCATARRPMTTRPRGTGLALASIDARSPGESLEEET